MSGDPYMRAANVIFAHDAVLRELEEQHHDPEVNPHALTLATEVLEVHRPSCCANSRCTFGDKVHCLACEAYKEEYGPEDAAYATHWPCVLATAALKFLGYEEF